jgi:hypothetical protein
MHDPIAVKAKYSAICPLCHLYIAKNHSWIIKLAEPLIPRGNGYRSADTGKPYNSNGSGIRMKPRWWIHERCVPRMDAPAKYPELLKRQSPPIE